MLVLPQTAVSEQLSRSWRPLAPAGFYTLGFESLENTKPCRAKRAAEYTVRLSERGTIKRSWKVKFDTLGQVVAFSIEPVYLDPNAFQLIEVLADSANCQATALHLGNSSLVSYLSPTQASLQGTWEPSGVRDFDNQNQTLVSSNSRASAQFPIRLTGGQTELYFFNAPHENAAPELKLQSANGEQVIAHQLGTRGWQSLGVFKGTRTTVAVSQAPAGRIRLGSIARVPLPETIRKTGIAPTLRRYSLAFFDFGAPSANPEQNSVRLDRLVEACRVSDRALAGCSIAFKERVELARPVYVKRGIHFSGMNKRALLSNRVGQTGSSAGILALGLITNNIYFRLADAGVLLNERKELLINAAQDSSTLEARSGKNWRQFFTVGDNIALIDRTHDNCIDENSPHCVAGAWDWLAHLRQERARGNTKLVRAAKPARAVALNVVEWISADGRVLTLRYPIRRRIAAPLLVNYSRKTYLNPKTTSPNVENFFSTDVSVANLGLRSHFAPIPVQGCVNCMFHNLQIGDSQAVPRNIVYGNGYVRSLVSDIRGTFSRHAIELAIGSERTTVRNVEATRANCSQVACDLIPELPHKPKADCLPMGIGLTEDASEIQLEQIAIFEPKAHTDQYCTVKALAISGDKNTLRDIYIESDWFLSGLNVQDSQDLQAQDVTIVGGRLFTADLKFSRASNAVVERLSVVADSDSRASVRSTDASGNTGVGLRLLRVAPSQSAGLPVQQFNSNSTNNYFTFVAR